MKNNYFLVIFSFVLFIYCVTAQTPVADWEIITGTTISTPNQFAYFVYTGNVSTGVALNTTIWPCFGSDNGYAAGNAQPNQTYYQSHNFPPQNTIVSEFWWDLGINPTTKGYSGVQATIQSLFTTRNYASKFDLTMTVLATNAQYGYLARMPIVGSDISFTKDTDLNEAYVTWTPTGNSLDYYSFYRYNSSYDYSTTGYVSGTACGIKEFMELAYASTVVTNSDGTMTATFDVEFDAAGFYQNSFAVVVTRNCTSLGIQCYEAVYYRVDVNSSNVLSMMSWTMLLLVAYLLILLLN